MGLPANKIRFIRRVLYKLKKDYGVPLDIYKILKSEYNPITGRQTVERLRIQVSKGILLPTVLATKFSYDLSYIAANKNFTYGGTYDIKDRIIIVDGIDVPPNITLDAADYLIVNGARYEVRTIEALEFNYGYIITCRETTGTPPKQVISFHLKSSFNVGQQITWR